MAGKTSFVPINENHSIKEAVITLFLSSPLTDIQIFENLYKDYFKKQFSELDMQHQVNISNIEDGKLQNSSKLTGFRYINIEKSKNTMMLQGVNEKYRSFISYHTFLYPGWESFLNSFIEYINVIVKYEDLLIKAFSLHYVDEFEVVGDREDEIDFEILFNTESSFLPRSFFENHPLRYLFMSNREGYNDRLEIRSVLRGDKIFVAISHNASKDIESQHAAKLIKEVEFVDIVTKMHEYNKETLKSLLSRKALSDININ